ncbi:DUF6484 domain-containing protein [Granulosicoccus antarcticus]|uniref:DUF6484 domain-containing protein n=1 Tax=Granulosicoccus antarcticus IMCC3135 TaxID=1192854 RepID=A0A2Z2NZC3_9GAMM|nr:DUF6484 domain-containing protein [Granulosicoccus antarcticus]ASJ76796.1 hypothetical protein IMCC3135_33775 [Granulosicoccus antarcticus IMCC3135]
MQKIAEIDLPVHSDKININESRNSALPAPVHGVLIGVLATLNQMGQPSVTYAGNHTARPVLAKSTTLIPTDAIGKKVALLFENGDITLPIVIGILQEPCTTAPVLSTIEDDTIHPAQSELIVDGRPIDLQAREQIILRCGKSSITMTSAGKIIIRGTYVSSKSSGANRIRGGSVQIN